MDYKKIGFKAGLEIHQQLATHKLFCKCQSALDENVKYAFSRRLRPVQSEMGDVDKAAIEEARRGREFLYYASEKSSCLVEADEEPPHEANEEAVDIVLVVSLLLNAHVVDEIHFMRKIVIDGSNTTGFQRTALIALNGKVDNVGIATICLEEDAARKIGKEGKKIKYALDRLGIPLVEIATEPEIKSPEHARQIAEKIGLMLRATKKVKRGIGTIRQDLNVSIKNGARVEIKGVQELNNIPKILENEVKRQLELIEVSKKLKKTKKMEMEIKDVSEIFKNTKSKFIKKALKDGVVLALKLNGFNGLIKGIKYKEYRLGKEFAMHARMEGGGIIHSDELPAYGISIEEVKEVKKILNCSNEDAFILSAGGKRIARKSLEAVFRRALQAFEGVPKEVRRAMPDGTTEYMRSMPGAARMYPETDVPPIRIKREKLKKIEKNLPELPDKKIERIKKDYGLSIEEAKQLVYNSKDEIFEEIALRHRGYEKIIARILLNIIVEIEREGYDSKIAIKKIDDVLDGLKKNLFAKEGVQSLLFYFVEHPEADIEEAIEKKGIKKISDDEVRSKIKKIVEEKVDFIKEKKERAISPLMGLVMKEFRGKVDGSIINKILREEIKKLMKFS